MRQVCALVGVVGFDDVEGVRRSTSAQGDVDPFSVGAAGRDGVGYLGGGTLGLVARDGIAIVEVSVD